MPGTRFSTVLGSDCQRSIDDFYSTTSSCGVDKIIYQVAAIAYLITGAFSLATMTAFIVVSNQRKAGTHVQRYSYKLVSTGFIVISPVALWRAVDPGNVPFENPAMVLLWASGLTCWHHGFLTYNIKVLMITALKYGWAMKGHRIQHYTAFAHNLNILLACVMGLCNLVPAAIFILSRHKLTLVDAAVVMYYAGIALVWGVGVPFVFIVVSRELRRNLRDSDMPDETPAAHIKHMRRLALAIPSLCAVYVVCANGMSVYLAWEQSFRRLAGLFFFGQFTIANLVAAAVSSVDICRSLRYTRTANVWDISERSSMHSCQNALERITQEVPNIVTEPTQFGRLPPVCERGVSLRFMQSMAHGTEESMTTQQFRDQVVLPITTCAKCSIWEAAWRGGFEEDHHIGPPTAMVSHAWSYKFKTILKSLEWHERRSGKDNAHLYFFDVFSMNQHDLAESKTKYEGTGSLYDVLLENLRMSITTPGKLLLVIETWEDPVPLKRCWCLYEIFVALNSHAKVMVAQCPAAERTLLQALKDKDQHAEFDKKLYSIDARNASASKEEDRLMILAQIEEIGMECYNEFLRKRISSAVKASAISAAVTRPF